MVSLKPLRRKALQFDSLITPNSVGRWFESSRVCCLLCILLKRSILVKSKERQMAHEYFNRIVR